MPFVSPVLFMRREAAATTNPAAAGSDDTVGVGRCWLFDIVKFKEPPPVGSAGGGSFYTLRRRDFFGCSAFTIGAAGLEASATALVTLSLLAFN